MSKYIDADAVKNIIRSGVSTDTEADQEYVCERIDEAPSIEIIRCGECKHWSKAPNTERGWCDVSDGLLKPTFFCADGERKGE